MTVRLLNRQDIDDAQWNSFLDNSPHNLIYAYSWYLDIVAPKWCAFIAENEAGWQAIMPVPLAKKWGFWVVKQPFFCQILGVFFRDNVKLKPEIFVNQLNRLQIGNSKDEITNLDQQKIQLSRLQIGNSKDEITNLDQQNLDQQKISKLLESAFKKQFRYVSIYAGQNLYSFDNQINTHILNLDKPYERLLEGYNKDRKKNLKTGQNFGWEIEESDDIEPIIALFKNYHANDIEGGVGGNAYRILRKLFSELKKRKIVKLLYVSKNNQIEAGALFVVFKSRIIYLFNAATGLGRKKNARTVLIDSILQQYENTNYVFDFESPEKESVVEFYESFGTQRSTFSQLRYNDLPFPFKQIQNLRLISKKQ